MMEIRTGYIYSIECISEHPVKGKKYIGSTIDIKKRFAFHKSDFKYKTHTNPELNYWARKKDIKFKFSILEKIENLTDRKYLLSREQFFIKQNIDNCFNITDAYGNFLEKKEKLDIKYLKINPSRTNKQQIAINKWKKTCKKMNKCKRLYEW